MLVEKFVIAFFECYDGPDGQRNRKNLHNAYDADSVSYQLLSDTLNHKLFSRSSR